MPTRVQPKPTHSAHWVGLGRYTLQGRETPEKSHGTYVLAFEQHEEACRFGMMLQVGRKLSLSLFPSLSLSCAPLASVPRTHRRPAHAVTSPAQAQGFDLARATKWTSELLGDFCDTADFSLGFVPDAALLIPPAQNFFVDHHELAEPPQSNSAADVFAAVPETSGNAEEVTAALLRHRLAPRCSPPYASPRIRLRARQAEAWGCSGPDGAELCANLENMFNLD
jgi:hypothetical protein